MMLLYLGISRDNYHHCDIVALLIDICGSRELFAREYRTLLADRLLVIENINELFKEIKYLKLLQVKLVMIFVFLQFLLNSLF